MLKRGLYLVTPDWNDTEALLEALRILLPEAPAVVQYRNKLAAPAHKATQARALLAPCRAAGIPLLINDDLDLALAIDADGVHLGRDDGDLVRARRMLGPRRILGVSCYGEWARAEAGVAAGADYVAFGALFPSSTKPQAPRATPDLLTRAKAGLGVPVAAIGGITLDNAPALIAAGADLLAVISDVFSAPGPAARAAAYRELFASASQDLSAP